MYAFVMDLDQGKKLPVRPCGMVGGAGESRCLSASTRIQMTMKGRERARFKQT